MLPKEKTTAERLRGVLDDLGNFVHAVVPHSQPREGQAVLHSVTAFINNLLDYFADHLSDITQLTPCIVSTIGPEDRADSNPEKDALFSLLDATLAASVNCLHTYLAQRTFEALYSTLVVNSAIDPEWNTGEKLVSGTLVLSSILTCRMIPWTHVLGYRKPVGLRHRFAFE